MKWRHEHRIIETKEVATVADAAARCPEIRERLRDVEQSPHQINREPNKVQKSSGIA